MRQNERIKIDPTPKLFDVVELQVGRASANLPAGAVGTIVEELPGDYYLVEFCDPDGRTLSVETLPAKDIAVHG